MPTALRDYLRGLAEPMPEWLSKYCAPPSQRINRSRILRDFMKSRIVFYPGGGTDGQPVACFNSGGAAHCYLYVDYMISREEMVSELCNRGFIGYRSLDRIDLEVTDFPS